MDKVILIEEEVVGQQEVCTRGTMGKGGPSVSSSLSNLI